MKRRHGISLLILLAGLTVSAGFFLFPRQLPPERCSVVYREYKDDKDIRATFIHDFQVNDTLRLDVTLLEATSPAGWDTLRVRFRIKQLPDFLEQKIANGEDKVTVRLAPKDSPSQTTDTTDLTNNYAIAISRLYRTVSIFHTHNLEEMFAVNESKYDKPD